MSEPVGTKVVETLASVDVADWDALAAPHSFYMSHAWLSSVEADQRAASEYVLAELRGRLVGALPLYRVREEDNPFYRPEQIADGRWPRDRHLLGGTRRAYVNGLLVRDELPPSVAAEVLEHLLAAAAARAPDLDGMLFLYLSARAATALVALREDLQPLFTGIDVEIPLAGATFDDYLAMFGSRRRRKITRELRAFEAAGYEVGRVPLADCYEEAGPLFGNVQRRYGYTGDDDRWTASLRRQAEHLGASALALTCRRAGRLVGFVLTYPWRGVVYPRLLGFDYDALTGAYEYFNLGIYEPVRLACEIGAARVHLGRESYEGKLRRGGRAAATWSVEWPFGSRAPARGQVSASELSRCGAADWSARYGASLAGIRDGGPIP